MYPIIDKKKTAERLKRMMNLSGKTPVDIQEYLGLSCVQTVYRWLEGINIPSVDNLYALSQMFNIPMDAMIGGNRKNLDFYPVKFMVFDWMWHLSGRNGLRCFRTRWKYTRKTSKHGMMRGERATMAGL